MFRSVWLGAALVVSAVGDAWASGTTFGLGDGGLLLLALLVFIPLRAALRIVPEWIRSFHEPDSSEQAVPAPAGSNDDARGGAR